jgi:prepilin-type N-terminal cleavage/methylation domain-containing protein
MYKKIKAFTLIELLVVIAIVGVLSGFIIVSMNSAINAARDAKIKSDIGTLSKALLVYVANNSTYPGGTGTTPDTYPCTIGGGTTRCTNLETNLAPYLTATPKTPSNGFYTYSYSGTGPSFTLQSTLSTGSVYQYNSSSYFSTLSYASTCAAATNTQVQCTPITISSTEEACKCTYLSGAGTTTWTTPNGVTQVQYLVVAGGGGGGGDTGGGGGAGGFRTNSSFSVNGVLTITVGAGGAGGNSGANGSDSIFSTITSAGGGGGGYFTVGAVGNNGGSGGGNAGYETNPGSSGRLGNTPATTPPQGNNGGYGGSNPYGAGGGGGGGGVGGNGGNPSGNGGAGLSSLITGTAIYYAGGGGGGADNFRSRAAGSGGSGGGGNGGYATVGSPGTNGLGGGGGGGGNNPNHIGGNGGSGVVIIRYLHP